MNTHELLIKARAIQAERGHCQGTLRDHQGRSCLAASLIEAEHGAVPIFGITSNRPPRAEMLEALGFMPETGPGASPWYGVCAWNNQPGRTLDDVLARLDRGIAITAPKREPALV